MPAVPRRASLEPMTAAELDRWSVHSAEGFVRQQVEAGLQPLADARRDAARMLAEQLPDGLDTVHHHVLRVRDTDTGETVGSVWLRVRPGPGEVEGYLFDIELLPPARGRGLGRATLLAVHETARALGATVMRLNVFGHNGPAIALYESLGYQVADLSLQLRLAGRPGPVPPGPAVRLVPDDPATPGRLLWTAYDGREPVAVVRLALGDRSDGLHARLDRLEVHHGLRRRGYGRAVAAEVLRTCREMRVRTVAVSLAGSDAPARALCEELGFGLTAQTMVLALTGP
ncbi:GNAT family N-acetyltransferase [Nocardioides panacis]|uniref:GNAT family N-acetyltransferase n=1 Tax=Nocardioides panacis TaxID=2849501 RepID=A0A975SZZ0_9ACTN|nr:GNAT family N-acetyltransferase [Nocardioides panacis]QWZ09059.1 GNAT family N-acetyltransferase [Nocardioides panacis]